MTCVWIQLGVDELYFEHILIENIFVFLSVFLVYDVTKLREVDVAIPYYVVRQVNNLLLHGVEA